jgi:hypothetical protein
LTWDGHSEVPAPIWAGAPSPTARVCRQSAAHTGPHTHIQTPHPDRVGAFCCTRDDPHSSEWGHRASDSILWRGASVYG